MGLGDKERASKDYPEAVLMEAQGVFLGEEIFTGREEAFGFTIDGPASLDLDDAIWVERVNGGHTIHVTIADVASLVHTGSALDEEARKRAFTRYLSCGNLPMIPSKLSEGILSLFEGEKRPTVTISVPLGDDLEIKGPVQVRKTYLISKRRSDYVQADEILAKPSDEIGVMLKECARLANGLLERRRRRGALAFFDIKRGIATSEEGALIEISPEQAHWSNLIIQEFMILTNAAVANFLLDHQAPALFRNHSAKAVAPQREVLLTDIDNAIAHPELFDLETLRQRIALVLNRATYGSRLTGHYGLNLPAYLHFTSPIRRYPDLVNQRILLAVLEGEPCPYTLDQLEDIATWINEVQKSREVDQKAFFRGEADQRARGVTSFIELDTDSFNRVIKVAVREDRWDPQLEEAIRNRLKEGKLEARDIYCLLFEVMEKREHWDRIKEAVVDWLMGHSHYGVEVLMMASQDLGWTAPEFETQSGGPEHRPIFKTVARIRIGEDDFASEPTEGASRKASQQLACVNLIGRILGLESKEGFSGEAVGTAEEKPETTNPKVVLWETCQRNHWGSPTFQTTKEGISHQPVFTTIAELIIDGEKYQSSPCRGSNKKEAEQRAAADLLAKLPNGPERQGEASAVEVKLRKDNYVNTVQEWAQKSRLPLPDYSFEEIPGEESPVYRCVCTIHGADGGTHSYSGQALDKKTAKQLAAKKAWRSLQVEPNG